MKRNKKTGKRRPNNGSNFETEQNGINKKFKSKSRTQLRKQTVAKKCDKAKKNAAKSCCKNKSVLRNAKSLCPCKQCSVKRPNNASFSKTQLAANDCEISQKNDEKHLKKQKRKRTFEKKTRPTKKLSVKLNCEKLVKSTSVLNCLKAPKTSAKTEQPRLDKNCQGSNCALPVRFRTSKKSKSLLKYVLKQQNVKELASHNKCSCCQKCISKLMRFIKVEIARQGCVWMRNSPKPKVKSSQSFMSRKLNGNAFSKVSFAKSSQATKYKRNSFKAQGVKTQNYAKKAKHCKKSYSDTNRLNFKHSTTKKRMRNCQNNLTETTDATPPLCTSAAEKSQSSPTTPKNEDKGIEKEKGSKKDKAAVPEVSAGVQENPTHKIEIPDSITLKNNALQSHSDFNMFLPDAETKLKTLSHNAFHKVTDNKKMHLPTPGNHGDQIWLIEDIYKRPTKKTESKKRKQNVVKLEAVQPQQTPKQKYPPTETDTNAANESDMANKYKRMLIPAVSAGTSVAAYTDESVLTLNPTFEHGTTEKTEWNTISAQKQVDASAREKTNYKPHKQKDRLKSKVIKITRKSTRHCKPSQAIAKRKNQKRAKITRVKCIRKSNTKSKQQKKVKGVAMKLTVKAAEQSKKSRKNKKNVESKWKLLTAAVIKKLKSAIQKRLIEANDLDKKEHKKKTKPQIAPMPRTGKHRTNTANWMNISDDSSNFFLSSQKNQISESSIDLDDELIEEAEQLKPRAPCPSARIPTFIAMIKTAIRDLTPFGLTGKKAIAK